MIYFLCIVVCMLFSSIIIVRYNIINSIHNFINNSIQNQYDVFITTTLLLLIVVLMVLIFFINNKNIVFFFFKNVFLFLFFLLFYNIYIDFFNKTKNIILIFGFTFLILLIKKNKLFCIITQTNLFLLYFLKSFSFVFLFVGVTMNKQIIKNTVKYKIKHTVVLLFLFLVLYQNYIFIVECLWFSNQKIQQVKINYLYQTINTTNTNFLKQKSFIEDILNTSVLLNSFFEKNITIKNSLELYNFNNQIFLQTNLYVVYCIFIYYIYSLRPFYFYFLNKEHCLHINI